MNLEVGKTSISNLMIDHEVDSLRFWYRTNQLGVDFVEYNDLDTDRIDNYYTYSSHGLTYYNCGGDMDCEETIDDLSAAWNALLLASSISAVLAVVSWMLGSPRNFYACLYNTKVFDNGVREEKKVWLWFLKPVGLTYALTMAYAVVFGIQFMALFRYINRLPSNEAMYALSLHYLNSDPTLCSTTAPCEFTYDSVYSFNRNYAFLIAAVVFAALSLASVALSHNLKLKSIQWSCFGMCCTSHTAPLPVSKNEFIDEENVPSPNQNESSYSSAPPEAIFVTSLEVQGTKLTDVDLTSEC
jgi:uncharacterized membrane protein YjjB (DUF3815 family)